MPSNALLRCSAMSWSNPVDRPAMLSCVIVGGGPGGLGPLLWAAQHGRLPAWLDEGVAVVERSTRLGGSLGRYGINSDSLGGSYLECLDPDVLPEPLLPSNGLLSHAGLAEANDILRNAAGRRIVILGGSHSAYAVAWALLELPGAATLGEGQIAIVQRRPPRVFYPDKAAADADQYPVDPGDICPRTRRVNRMGGVRGHGRDIWRRITHRPGTEAEKRVAVL